MANARRMMLLLLSREQYYTFIVYIVIIIKAMHCKYCELMPDVCAYVLYLTKQVIDLIVCKFDSGISCVVEAEVVSVEKQLE